MPQKESNEEIIESISTKEDLRKDGYITKFREINKEKRTNIYHMVVHFLAFIIIVPYIFLIIYNIRIPESYSTIVSVVVGFYFARSLFKDI